MTGSASPFPSISTTVWTAQGALETPFFMKVASISSRRAASSSAFLLASLAALLLRLSWSLSSASLCCSSVTSLFLSASASTVLMCYSSSDLRWSLTRVVGTESSTSRVLMNSKHFSCSHGTTSLSKTSTLKLSV